MQKIVKWQNNQNFVRFQTAKQDIQAIFGQFFVQVAQKSNESNKCSRYNGIVLSDTAERRGHEHTPPPHERRFNYEDIEEH